MSLRSRFTATVTFLLTVSLASFLPTSVSAEVEWRGFQNVVVDFYPENIAAAGIGTPTANFWQANIYRVLIWDSEEDSYKNYDDYLAAITPQLDYIDLMLPHFCDAGMKINIALFSTPGGLCNRGVAGEAGNLCIFVESWAQEAMVRIWDVISERVANSEHRECIHGLALANEPGQSKVASGLKSWKELVPDLVETIRANDSTIKILIPSVYATPDRMTKLPPIDDPNIYHVVHFYPDLHYAHSGFDGFSTSKEPPSNAVMNRKLFQPLAKKLIQWEKWQRKGRISSNAPLRFFVSETTITREARDPDVYLERMFSAIEGENAAAGRPSDGKAKKKKCKKKKSALKKKKCKKSNRLIKRIPDLDFAGYTNLPFRGNIDQFNVELPEGTGTTKVFLPNLTERGAVIKNYFERNLGN